MTFTRRSPKDIPPRQASRESRWEPIEKEIRDTPIGECLVITVGPEGLGTWASHIEKFCATRGMKVRASKRRTEIWIERIS